MNKDPRIPQVRKVASAMFNAAFLSCSNTFNDMMISDDNNLVIINEKTLIYSIPLINEPLLPSTIIDLSLGVNPFIDENGKIRKDDGDEYCIGDIHLLKVMNDCYNYYRNAEINCKLLAKDEYEELENDNSFEKLLNMKKADGMKFYKMNGLDINESYIVPIFTGFPKLNKSDTIGISIYDLDNQHLLIIFDIFKKKINRNYKIYFRTIKLGNNGEI